MAICCPQGNGTLRQGGITCGAIDEPRKSSKAIDKRVIIDFCDKNVVIARFRDKNDGFILFIYICIYFYMFYSFLYIYIHLFIFIYSYFILLTKCLVNGCSGKCAHTYYGVIEE